MGTCEGKATSQDEIQVDTRRHQPLAGPGSSVGVKTSTVRLAASSRAFAFWPLGGQVVTWGDPKMGGDTGSVRDQLRCVQQVEANRHAFAAIRTDGSVATWGNKSSGGDSSRVQDQLKEVVQICAVDDGDLGSAILWW